jgi:hypothetical protein
MFRNMIYGLWTGPTVTFPEDILPEYPALGFANTRLELLRHLDRSVSEPAV